MSMTDEQYQRTVLRDISGVQEIGLLIKEGKDEGESPENKY